MDSAVFCLWLDSIFKVFSDLNDSLNISPCKVLTVPQVYKGSEIPVYCRLLLLISSDGPYNIGDF